MEIQTALSKTIGLQKTAFTNTLAIMTALQQQGQEFLKATLEQSPWLPVTSKDVCLYWADFYSKSLENVKSLADQGFAEIERFSSPATKSEEKKSPKTKTAESSPPPSRPAKIGPGVKKNTVQSKKSVSARESTAEKRTAEKVPAEKQVALQKLETKGSDEVKAVATVAKPSALSQTTDSPALKENVPTGNPLQKKS